MFQNYQCHTFININGGFVGSFIFFSINLKSTSKYDLSILGSSMVIDMITEGGIGKMAI